MKKRPLPRQRAASPARSLSRTVVRQRLTAATEEMLDALLGVTGVRAQQLVRALTRGQAGMTLDGTDPDVESVLAVTRRLFSENVRRALAQETQRIVTEDDLIRREQEIRRAGRDLPSMLRKVLKAHAASLPRRGGPGRGRLLSPEEASRACDHIAELLRRKHTVKDALAKTAEASVRLFGKKVGARTLQKAWAQRDTV